MATESKTDALNHYRLLGKSGLRVSPLCLGTMTFGTNWKDWMGAVSQETVFDLYDTYYKAGGNFIDTANKYQEGQSEEWLGQWLAKRGVRDEMVIASKYSLPMKKGVINLAGNHRKNMFASIDASLKRLGTNYIDLYYVHYWDFTTGVEEIMRGLDDLVRSGKVHYVAISDAPAWQVSRANMLADLRGWSPFIAYQGKFHIGERDMEREIFPMAEELGMGVVPWGVVGQGKFTGKYKKGETAVDAQRKGVVMSDKDYAIADEVLKVASEVKKTPSQVVLNWTLHKPNCVPLLGVRNCEQLKENLGALDFSLSKDQLNRLNEVSKFDLGFPHNFTGTSVKTCPWLKDGGVIESDK